MAAAAVKLTSPDPMLFSQRRTGKHGREFSFHKFRTMGWNAEIKRDALLDLNEVDRPVFKIREDPLLTPVGRFMRHASIDELPLLWNVLRDEMSWGGPRPLPTEEAAQCSDWESQRLHVKPGITCIWQVSGRSDLDFESWVRMDLEYIEEWSLWFDLELLAKTIPAVLSGRGAY
jgi:lipopolysaccharide/colanic/teichoic acid biosynthesis glycosyltransferase